MCGSHETPDPTLDPELELRIRASREAPARVRDAWLAAAGDCPAEEDLTRLADGRLVDAERRRELGRHLVSCPRCADRNLGHLLAADAAAGATPPLRSVGGDLGRALPGPIRPAARAGRWAAAAAILLATVVGLGTAERTTPALDGAWLVDPYGFELRSLPAEPVGRRVLVRASADGVLALVRRSASDVGVERLDGPHEQLPVAAGEEVVLPLRRALEVPAAEDWLVLHLESPVSDAELRALARRAVVGERPAGVNVLRFAVAPTKRP
ncbi:MAG: hypothetical protein ACF8XB_24555 [Planctomycetota bacterium JB042]